MTTRASTYLQTLLALSSTIFMAQAGASGATFRVTNDGTDSAACGAASAPCRSISQAIENASDGDLISVGAGIYGNISGDGTYSHPGDEHPRTLSYPQSQACVVCVDKRVQIVSLHGPSVTIIRGAPVLGATTTNAVMILKDGVTFGSAGGGFTITGGNSYGVHIDLDAIARTEFPKRVAVAGNVDVGDIVGFRFDGVRYQDGMCAAPEMPPWICTNFGTYLFNGNQAIDNSDSGFALAKNVFAGPVTVQNNAATGGGTGFHVITGAQNPFGSPVDARAISLTGNVARHNGIGYSTLLSGALQNNSAIANDKAGFFVIPYGNTVFRGNSAIGNGGPGLIANFSAESSDDHLPPEDCCGPRSFGTFAQNNFYGNDRNRPALKNLFARYLQLGATFDPGASAHCGVLNVGALAALPRTPPAEPITATNNYWGSTQGPAATGAADAAGGQCDVNGGKTNAKPFATVAFGITSIQ